MPNGRTYPMMPSTQWPNEVLNTEAWKFQGGKITRVEAVFLGLGPTSRAPGGREAEKEKNARRNPSDSPPTSIESYLVIKR